MNLGNNNGTAIVNPSDGNSTQNWDIYQLSNGNYVIYNNGTNNVLARGGGCTTNGGTYMYCAVVQPEGSGPPENQQWQENRENPMVFESVNSGGRCLDNPGSNAPAGSQVALYPCNVSDANQQWLG
jgi:hypothetical protein